MMLRWLLLVLQIEKNPAWRNAYEATAGEASHRQKHCNTQRSFRLPFSQPNYAT